MVLRHRHPAEQAMLADVTTASLDDVKAFRPELAVLSNPSTLHAGIAQHLLSLGCHLLIEKPLASNKEDGLAILEAAKSSGLVCRVGYNLRHLPSLKEFRRQLHQGVIGRTLCIRCEVGQHLGTWRTGIDYREGVSARKDMGGGVLLELSHELDYLNWIFGPIDWVSAWLGRQSNLEIDVEDTAQLLLGFRPKSGTPALASLSMDFIRHDATRRCVVIGEMGSLSWDGLRGSVEVCLQGSSQWTALFENPPDRDLTYRAQWDDFLEAVTAQGVPRNSNGATL
jgi:predicted dehydrogenase